MCLFVSWRQRTLAAPPFPEIVLWSPLRDPAASQTSECRELLSRARASYVILAQRQPGKLPTPRKHGIADSLLPKELVCGQQAAMLLLLVLLRLMLPLLHQNALHLERQLLLCPSATSTPPFPLPLPIPIPIDTALPVACWGKIRKFSRISSIHQLSSLLASSKAPYRLRYQIDLN